MTLTFNLHQGTAPLLVSMPHLGVALPDELKPNYVPRALEVEDADWHLNHLYNFLKDMGASILTPVFSRYVIDLNRPPDDAPMYPGASNTELCPTRFFTVIRFTKRVVSLMQMRNCVAEKYTGNLITKLCLVN